MDSYFPGISAQGPFEISTRRKAIKSIQYEYAETWQNTGRAHTLRCGVSSKLSVSKTIGISKTDSESLKDFIEGSIGPTAIAQVKSHVEKSRKMELTLSESTTEIEEFNLPAPECGSSTFTLYQLVRDNVLSVTRNRNFLGPITQSVNFREHTKRFDMRVEFDKNDPLCPCKPKNVSRKSEVLRVRIGQLFIKVDCDTSNSSKGTRSFSIGNFEFTLYSVGGNLYGTNLARSDVPEFIRFLADISKEDVLVSGYPIKDDYLPLRGITDTDWPERVARIRAEIAQGEVPIAEKNSSEAE